MVIKNAQELFMQLLSETYSAEKQMTRALPKMARAADDKKLVEGFEHHLERDAGPARAPRASGRLHSRRTHQAHQEPCDGKPDHGG